MPKLATGVTAWFALALLSGAKLGDAVSCKARSGGMCGRTQREQCISDRDDLRSLCRGRFGIRESSELEDYKENLDRSRGRNCPGWNVTVDDPHEHTPSFRPENVSLTVEVNSDSNQFRIYAAWARQDSDLLSGYEFRVIQRNEYGDFMAFDERQVTSCTVTNKTTNHFQTPMLDLSVGKFVKVEVVTSPFEAFSEDCNMYTDMFHIPSGISGNLTNLHTLCERQVSDITVSQLSADEVHITWKAPASDLIYFVSVTDPGVSPLPNCREPGDSPPCFVTNVTSVTIGPLDLSKNYILNINAFPTCDGYEIMGVYNGCRGVCCQNYPIRFSTPSTLEPSILMPAVTTVLPHPTTVDRAVSSATNPVGNSIPPSLMFSIEHRFISSSVGLVKSSISPDSAPIPVASTVLPRPTTTDRAVSSAISPVGNSVPPSSLTLYPISIEHHFNSSSMGLVWSSTLPDPGVGLPATTDKRVVVAIAAALGAILAVAIVTLAVVIPVFLRRRLKCKKKKLSTNSCNNYEERYDVDNKSSCNGIRNLSVCTSNTSLSKEPAPIHTYSPSFSDSTEVDTKTHVSKPFSLQTAIPSVLVIYSPRCPAEDKHVLLQFLLSDLQGYDIRTTSHDWHLKGNIPMWIEQEVKRSTVVLCVCNRQFQQEWEQQVATDCKVVYALQQLMYASLSQCEDLSSKFAVVLLRQSDRQFIPTQYLQSVKRFYVNQVKEIAHFVKQVPPYECRSPPAM